MPAIEVPFVTELRPFEDLKLSSGIRPDAEAAASSSGAKMNTFMAMVSSVHFEELVESTPDRDNDDDSAAAAEAGTKKNEKAPAKDVDVRISLVANMVPVPGEKRNSSALRCVTLASHTFRAPSGKDSKATPGHPRTVDTSLLVLKSPLSFSSDGAIRSLSVLAHVVPADGSQAKGAKVYRGSRRFMVRLLGVQQTTLTAEQVLLLAGTRK